MLIRLCCLLLLTACSAVMQDKGGLERNNQINGVLGCGVQCLTIAQDSNYKHHLKRFLRQQHAGKTLVLAPCRNRPASQKFMEQVAKDIMVSGVRVAKSRPMVPYTPPAAACLMLVRGPVILYPPRCLTKKRKPGAFVFPADVPLVGDDFGCYSQQNLANMIDNPADLLSLSGFSGQIR